MGQLHLVGGNHVVQRAGRIGVELVGANPAGQARPFRSARFRQRAGDQLGGGGPIEAHAALRGVHRLGDLEAEAPKVAPKGERGVPVDGGDAPGL